MGTFLLIVHLIICIGLIISILLQSSKGGGLSGAFGGAGGGGAVFGGAGAATFLSKVTTYLGVLFFLTCIGLWYTSRSADDFPTSAAERLLQEQGPRPLQSSPQFPPPAETEQATETPAPASTAKDTTK
jgi:preprotein translocase subunit SecG